MSVSWRISEGLVVLESDEQSAMAEWQSAVTLALISDQFRPGMALLHDARKVERVPDPAEARMRVWFLTTQTRRHGVARWATVVSGPARYGIGRLAEAIVDRDRSAEFRIFLDMAEAEAWLREGLPAS